MVILSLGIFLKIGILFLFSNCLDIKQLPSTTLQKKGEFALHFAVGVINFSCLHDFGVGNFIKFIRDAYGWFGKD